MKLKNTIATVTGAVLLAGALFTGAAFAAGETTTEAPIFKQLNELRQSYRDKMKTEAAGLINEALASGSITQEQADKLLTRGAKSEGMRGGHGGPGAMRGKKPEGMKGARPEGMPGGHGGPGRGGKGGAGLGGAPKTQEEAKAHLDGHVQEGKLTQEQADQMLQKWLDNQAK